MGAFCCKGPPAAPRDDQRASSRDFSLTGLVCDATVVDIYDGDTVRIEIAARDVFPTGMPETLQFRARLAGIDTPELKPPLASPGREAEVRAAKSARDALAERVRGRRVVTECGKFDKYGRVLVTFRGPDGSSINDWMVESGHATRYDGKRKTPFAEHKN